MIYEVMRTKTGTISDYLLLSSCVSASKNGLAKEWVSDWVSDKQGIRNFICNNIMLAD